MPDRTPTSTAPRAGSVSGKLRAIAVTSNKRWPGLPNVPTLEKAGVEDAESDTFQAIYIRAGTPQPIVDRLYTEIKTVAALPEIKALMVKLGTIPVDSPPPPELQKFLASEIDHWGRIIERAGVQKS